MNKSVAPEGHTEFIARLRFANHHMLYLESCARIRGISVQGLVRKLMYIIARDQLVMGVADGDDLKKINDGAPSRDRGVPADKLFDAVTRPSKKCIVTGIEDVTDAPRASSLKANKVVTTSLASRRRTGGSVPVTRSNWRMTTPKQSVKSRSELRAELAEAVANTAAMPVE